MDSHIDVPETAECAFCAYLAGSRPYTILVKYALASVLVTREQRGVGHVLVVPNRHCSTLLEANSPERHALIDLVAKAAEAIDLSYGRPGIAVWQNNGVPAHQMIPHLHFHVAGTLDGGGTNFGDVPESSITQTEVIAARLRESNLFENSRSTSLGSEPL